MKPTAAAAQATHDLLARLWERNLPLIQDRLRTLDAAANAACTGHLAAGLRDQAISDAHKLAGSLGMFGYPRGSELAREIEVLLESPGLPATETLTALATALRDTLSLQA